MQFKNLAIKSYRNGKSDSMDLG